MFKKVIIILSIFLISPCAYGIDRCELNVEFFSRFNDKNLEYYINRAIDNNHEAKQASMRVEQYRQQVKSSFGKELPSLSVGANYLGVHVPMLDNFTLSQNAFVLPFIMNYEADFLLKNRDKTKSAKKSYEISLYDEKTIYISLLSDVATIYTNILEYDELIKISSEIVAIYTDIYNADIRKFDRGIISTEEINISAKNVENAKNELETLKKQQKNLLMQLAVLTGESALNIDCLQRGDMDSFEYSGIIPDEITSDVIFSRPDVMAAEAALEKAKIDTRIARKEFLPRFNITGIWAFNTIAEGSFFSWESSLAAILAGAVQDIFKGGQKIANLRFQKAKYEELFEKYRQTDLNAVKEINTSLFFIEYDTIIENNTLKKLEYEYNNLTAKRRKFERETISTPEYLNNLAGFLEVKKEVYQAKNQRLVNYYTLYKATGGNL